MLGAGSGHGGARGGMMVSNAKSKRGAAPARPSMNRDPWIAHIWQAGSVMAIKVVERTGRWAKLAEEYWLQASSAR